MQSLEEVYKIQNAHSGYCYGLADFGSVVWTFGWDKRICLWDTKVPAAPSPPPPPRVPAKQQLKLTRSHFSDWQTFKNLGELPPYHGDAIRQVVEVWDHKTASWQAWYLTFFLVLFLSFFFNFI